VSSRRHVGNLEGVSFTWGYGRWSKEGSGNGASLSTGVLRGEQVGWASLLVTLKDIKKAVETVSFGS
jgi:hypothetical protein